MRADAVHAAWPGRLQPPLHARVLRGKGVQFVGIGCAERLQMAQHQRRDRIAAGQFDLGAGVARIQAGNQRPQRQEQSADVRRQNGAAAHVGDVAAFALVKANQHLAFFHHMAHRQPRAPAVAPCRAVNGAQHGLRAAFAQMPEVVLQHALLDGDLGGRVQMLHLAAAASACMQAKVRAARLHPLRRFAVDVRERGRFPVVFAAAALGADPFTGQRAFDKHHLAIGPVRHTLRVQIQ